MMRANAVALLSLLTMAYAANQAALAQTSSWEHRIVPPPKPAPKAGRPAAKVRSQPVAPSPGPATPLPAGPGTGPPPAAARLPSLGPATDAGGSTHAKSASSDPAYEAFEQGRYLTALELATGLAGKGDPQAHTLIGRIHAEGLGVPADPSAAASWYRKGADLGDVEAVVALGTLHAQGQGVEQDYAAAARYFEAAAAKGHAVAAYNLALLFLAGKGKPENPYRGFGLMLHAAERDVVRAQYDLGTLYATGTGTEPNAFEAAKWIGRAARRGLAEAEVEYGIILFKGHGTPPDEKKGAELFRSAAEKGVAVAMNRLARCFAHGRGVEKDLTAALTWHLLAKAGGVEDQVLDQMLARLSRTDKAKAQADAETWRERRLLQ